MHIHRAAPVAVAVVLALSSSLLTGCPKKKSDAERAAEERAAADKRVTDSYVLVPYRALKAALRARGATPPPAELAELMQALDHLQRAGHAARSDAEAKAIATFLLDLYRAREHMRKVDEDHFPTLWTSIVAAPPPLAFYDAGFEHLMLGLLSFVFDVTLQRDPVADILFYELSRAKPAPGWPPSLTVAARGGRGLAYLTARYHYAADEELTTYLAEVERLGAATPDRAELLAGGYFARALNRFALDRDDPATADLEAGLKQLQSIGVDNELTDWGFALVYARSKRYDEARKHLEKLAASPNLSDADRAEIRACAATLGKWDKGFVPFGKTRAQLVIVRALIARAGGLETIFSSLLGPELGPKVYAPLALIDRVRAQLGAAPHEALDTGKEVSRKGIDVVRGKLDALRRGDKKGASPSPDGGA